MFTDMLLVEYSGEVVLEIQCTSTVVGFGRNDTEMLLGKGIIVLSTACVLVAGTPNHIIRKSTSNIK